MLLAEKKKRKKTNISLFLAFTYILVFPFLTFPLIKVNWLAMNYIDLTFLFDVTNISF